MSGPPTVTPQLQGWTDLIQFVGSKGWTVELTEHGSLRCTKDGAVVFGHGPLAGPKYVASFIARLGYADGLMNAARRCRP